MASELKIERRPLGEQVTSLVRRMIQEGELTPGVRLVEEHLAAVIGTSRTPIREALHRLEQEKLVMRRKQGGYQVRPLSAREVEETAGVRAVLESYAVELAALRMTPKLLAELERNVESFAAALEDNDAKRMLELNTKFHHMLYEVAGSELLIRMINDLSEPLQRFRVELLGNPESAARSLRDHRRMLRALKNGDQIGAVRVCREHILAGGQWMLDRLREKTTGRIENDIRAS